MLFLIKLFIIFLFCFSFSEVPDTLSTNDFYSNKSAFFLKSESSAGQGTSHKLLFIDTSRNIYHGSFDRSFKKTPCNLILFGKLDTIVFSKIQKLSVKVLKKNLTSISLSGADGGSRSFSIHTFDKKLKIDTVFTFYDLMPSPIHPLTDSAFYKEPKLLCNILNNLWDSTFSQSNKK